MQITKLELDNFSSYEGVNSIDFTAKRGKPIVLIGGQNGAGKTSIFSAIKIALYGPLTFGYTGVNSHYYKRIRSFVNNKAFQLNSFSSGVKLDFKIKKGREKICYSIERKWSIDESKIIENYSVFENGKELNSDDLDLFENYILTIIPVDIFDFFLFDGEEVGNIFSTDNYNKYIKSALLTMCGIDDFEILRNFCKNYIGRSEESDGKELHSKYSQLIFEQETTNAHISDLMECINRCDKECEELTIQIEQKNAQFLRAGGMHKNSVNALENREKSLNSDREKINSELKSFFENEMPFFIMRGMIPMLRDQIQYEERATIYEYVGNMLSPEYLDKFISDKVDNSKEISEELYDVITKRFQPKNATCKDVILDLSKADESYITNLETRIDDINPNELLEKISRKQVISKELTKIRKKLRNSLSEEDSRRLLFEIDSCNEKIELLRLEKKKAELELEISDTSVKEIENQMLQIKKTLIDSTQNKNVIDLSSKISLVMDTLINTKLDGIRESLSTKIISNLNLIYRKDNLISTIEITSDFRLNLYQEQQITVYELKSLIENVGAKEFNRLIGKNSVLVLCDYFNVNEMVLENSIRSCSDDRVCFDLYKRIELNTLSKGERQIFILALYWAIIQLSDNDIPFIIDTPYARIDANHREEISEKFFPNISKQVVILSTDEEITNEYYNIIKPYISKEYLLNNNQSENRTTVTKGYFFKEV